MKKNLFLRIKRLVSPLIRWYAPKYVRNVQKRYDRAGFLNRIFYKYAFAECGANFKVNGSPLILEPGRIHIGDNFTINDGVQLCPFAHIYIGNNVTMSRGAQITSGGLDTTDWVKNRLNKTGQGIPHKEEDVYIGDGTWLCINSIVLSGVKISGRGVIVAAGAVVTHSFEEDYVVLGGVSAKIVKRLK